MSQAIQEFITTSTKTIDDWCIHKNEFALKSKTLAENKTSLETLQKNLGEDNPHIQKLLTQFTQESAAFQSTFTKYNQLESDLTAIKTHCITIMRDILALYEKLQQTTKTEEADLDPAPQEPEPVQIAKLLHSQIDNHQLRADPPIANVFKDYFRAGMSNHV